MILPELYKQGKKDIALWSISVDKDDEGEFFYETTWGTPDKLQSKRFYQDKKGNPLIRSTAEELAIKLWKQKLSKPEYYTEEQLNDFLKKN